MKDNDRCTWLLAHTDVCVSEQAHLLTLASFFHRDEATRGATDPIMMDHTSWQPVAWLAQLATDVTDALTQLHGMGMVHGHVCMERIVWKQTRWVLQLDAQSCVEGTAAHVDILAWTQTFDACLKHWLSLEAYTRVTSDTHTTLRVNSRCVRICSCQDVARARQAWDALGHVLPGHVTLIRYLLWVHMVLRSEHADPVPPRVSCSASLRDAILLLSSA
jgi:hypothetical protein